MVVVYTKAQCPQCVATEKTLKKLGVEYETRSAVENVEELKALGFYQAPVIKAGEEVWSGFQPDKLNALA